MLSIITALVALGMYLTSRWQAAVVVPAPRPNTPATDKALYIQELLESVLLALPVKDLLLAQRVCKHFQSTIKNSITLQRALFFELDFTKPGTMTTPYIYTLPSVFWPPPYTTPLAALRPPRYISNEDEPPKVHRTSPTPRFNPFFATSGNMPSTYPAATCTMNVAPPYIGALGSSWFLHLKGTWVDHWPSYGRYFIREKKNESWRKMWPTDPPVEIHHLGISNEDFQQTRHKPMKAGPLMDEIKTIALHHGRGYVSWEVYFHGNMAARRGALPMVEERIEVWKIALISFGVIILGFVSNLVERIFVGDEKG
jgi:hypothetical protein